METAPISSPRLGYSSSERPLNERAQLPLGALQSPKGSASPAPGSPLPGRKGVGWEHGVDVREPGKKLLVASCS